MKRKDTLKSYLQAAKVAAEKISVVDSRLESSKRILSSNFSEGAPKGADSAQEIEIVADDIGVSAGEYITDINISLLKSEVRDKEYLSVIFACTIGSRIKSRDDTIVEIKSTNTRISEVEISEIVGTSIKTNGYDSIFDFNSFSSNYEQIYSLVQEAEEFCMTAIDNHNVSSLNRGLYTLHSIFYSVTVPDPAWSERSQSMVAKPVFESSLRIFRYSISSCNSAELPLSNKHTTIDYEMVVSVVEMTYFMGQNSFDGHFDILSPGEFLSMLESYIDISESAHDTSIDELHEAHEKLSESIDAEE